MMSTTCASELSTLLFLNRRTIRHPAGSRIIRFGEPDQDPRFTRGPVQRRVLSYLKAHNRPITATHLASALCTRSERVTVSLNHLIANDKVIELRIDDDTVEYILKAPGAND